MSRPATAMNQGGTNKRFMLLALVLGLIGAVLVYVTLSRNSSTEEGSTAGTTPVVVARENIPARTRIVASMLEVRLVPEDARSAEAFADVNLVVGQATRFPIAANEQVLASKIVPLNASSPATSRSLAFVVPQGKRGLAVKVDQVAAAGGLILPGDYVDVVVIYDVEFSGREKAEAYFVHTLFQNVEVLAVQQGIVDIVPEATPIASGQRVRNSEAKPDPGATTATLALSPEDAQRMYLAEGNGRIRLSLRRFGDADERPIDFMVENDLFPRNIPNPFAR